MEIKRSRLSPLQKQLWEAQRESNGLRVQCLVRLSGRIVPERVEQALNEVLQHHEILRTVFQPLPGLKAPVQVVETAGKVAFEYQIFDEKQTSDSDIWIEQLWHEHKVWRFDWENGPLLCCTLATLKSDQHVLLITFPAIYGDAQSMSNIIGLIVGNYTDQNSVNTQTLQYIDIAEWHHSVLDAPEAETGKAYWLERVSRGYIGLHLAYDEGEDGGTAFEPDVFFGELPVDLSQGLENLASQQGVSLASLLFASWQILLGRLSGQPEFDLSFVVDGRLYPELQSALGLFARWLPMRYKFDSARPAQELYLQTQQEMTELQEWQDYYLGDSSSINSRSYGFAFFNHPTEWLANGVQFTLERLCSYTQPFRLHLVCRQMKQRLRVEWHYDTAHFAPASIACWVEQWQTLLEQLIKQSQAPIRQLNLLSERKRQQVVIEWNRNVVPFPQDQCIHQLVEAQARRTPNAAALVSREGALSYTEVNRKANQMARWLQAVGVKRGSRVGLGLPRGLSAVIARLAVLKAGAAYVTINMDEPAVRLSYVLNDSQAGWLLTEHRLQEPISEYAGILLDLDTGRVEMAMLPGDDLGVKITPADIAYVVYTSGSTGQPKGILTAHYGAVNYLTAYLHQVYGLNEQDVVLQIASLTFDASVRDTLGPLTVGARVVLPGENEGRDAMVLAEMIQKEQVTAVLSIVPSLLRVVLDAARHGKTEYTSLRLLVVSGEPSYRADAEKVWAVLGKNVRMIVQYGPTECTMTTTYQVLERDTMGRGMVRVGKPLPNAQLYVLNEQERPVAVGETGEVYIGGAGVTYGYVNHSDWTAARYVPDGFSGIVGARLYRTGDLARYWPGGELEFVGRMDEQVKIRGRRVELGEIEAVLNAHERVRVGAVMARGEQGKDVKLVAYVVPEGEIEAETLRDDLAACLPDYLVPAAYVFLDAMPRTAHGKVDRRALPEPARFRQLSHQPYVAPRSPTEKALVEIWSELLELDQIGVNDDFFKLGGHSLLAMQVVHRLNERFVIELPLRDLFITPTIARITDVIERIIQARDDEFKLSQLVDKIQNLSSDEVKELLSDLDEEEDKHE